MSMSRASTKREHRHHVVANNSSRSHPASGCLHLNPIAPGFHLVLSQTHKEALHAIRILHLQRLHARTHAHRNQTHYDKPAQGRSSACKAQLEGSVLEEGSLEVWKWLMLRPHSAASLPSCDIRLPKITQKVKVIKKTQRTRDRSRERDPVSFIPTFMASENWILDL